MGQPSLAERTVRQWEGDIATAELPDGFLVDYVRVYDLADAQ